MQSERVGENTLEIEVTNISSHGIWLYLNNKEYFMSYEEYPWFRDAKVSDILNVQLQHSNHIYWPDLDIDLSIHSIEDPAKYPLIARTRP
jgi:hypothetical protein